MSCARRFAWDDEPALSIDVDGEEPGSAGLPLQRGGVLAVPQRGVAQEYGVRLALSGQLYPFGLGPLAGQAGEEALCGVDDDSGYPVPAGLELVPLEGFLYLGPVVAVGGGYEPG